MTKRLLFLSFLLLLTSVFVYMHLSQKKATNSHNTFSDSEKEEADFYRTNYYVNLNNNGMELSDIMLKDSLGIISPLKNLLEKEKKTDFSLQVFPISLRELCEFFNTNASPFIFYRKRELAIFRLLRE